MWERRLIVALMSLGLVAAALGIRAVAEDQPAAASAPAVSTAPGAPTEPPAVTPKPETPQRPSPEAMREAVQQQLTARIRERLGITSDEEWAKIKPRMEKVQALKRSMAGAPRIGTGLVDLTTVTPLEKATTELRGASNDPNVTDEALAAKVEAFREAKAEVQRQLTAAQQELRDAVTLRQQAKLILSGMLD